MSETVRFGHLFAVPLRNGVSYATKQRGSGIPMVNMREIFAYDRISDQECELAPLTAREQESSLLSDGDLLFARQSLTYEGAGRCVLVLPSETARTWESHLIRVRLDENLACPAYYFYFFKSASGRHLIETIIQQVAAAGIRGSDLARLQVPSVPLNEQRAIAQVLGALDDKIDANKKLSATSASLRHAMFEASVRHSPEESLLSEITVLVARGVTPSYSEAEDSMTVLNQRCVRDQRIVLAAARRTLKSRVREDKILLPHDVLINSTGQGTLGRVARWTLNELATTDSHVSIVRFDAAKTNKVVAGHGLLQLQSAIEEMGEGSTGQTELSRTELNKLRVRLPASSCQEELGLRLSELSLMESTFLQENITLAATRDALLPQLMSGKLRVRDAEKVLEGVL